MEDIPNLKYIKELSGEDTIFEQKFIQILKEEFPEEVQIYTECIKNEEAGLAGEIVHKLKHKFNILSMANAYEFAVNYEEELRVGDTNGDHKFRKILETIKNYLNTI